MSISLEIDPTGKILAKFDSAKDAVDFAKQFTGTNGSHASPEPPTPPPTPGPARVRRVAEAVSGLRERQKGLLREVATNNGTIGDEALRAALNINRSALGGLLAGISKSLAVFGIDRKMVIDSRVSEQDGSIEYYIPARSIDEVLEGLTD